jgi:predicted kinase
MQMYILRGLPSSGKSTLAEILKQNGVVNEVHANDDYYHELAAKEQTTYRQVFNPKFRKRARAQCLKRVESALKAGKSVAVANVFHSNATMNAYIELARLYGAQLFVITVERNATMSTINDHMTPRQWHRVSQDMADGWEPHDSRLVRRSWLRRAVYFLYFRFTNFFNR